MPPQNRTPADLNYAVLSRYLPRLHQILTTASYAHIYFWSSASQAWSKANFEGSIFIVSLHPPPPTASNPAPAQTEEYLLFLLNRSGLDNFSYELRDPAYIDSECGDIMMLRENDPRDATSTDANADKDKDKEVVYGLFVSCEANTSTAGDRERLSRAMKECATTFQATSAAATVPTPPPPPPPPSPPPPRPPPQELAAGRQISLMELFQQEGGRGRDVQRESHYGHVPSMQQQQQQGQGYYTQAGWEGVGVGHPLPASQQQGHYGQPTGSGAPGGGGDLLMNLFQRASDARFRGGTPTQGQGY